MKRLLMYLMGFVLLCCSVSFAEMEIVTDIPISVNSVGSSVILEDDQLISATTGMPIDHENRTMVVQLDNEPGARPQKGVGSADIVYETELYNGGYTRYTAVFNDTIPEKVEAVRSARIVNIDFYKEYDGTFVHYGTQGGDNDAGDYIERVRLGSRYDGLKGIAGFYRDSSRKAPNNVICNLKDLYDKTNWFNHVQKSPLKFSETGYTVMGDPVNDFSIEYRSGSYVPSYVFKDGKYYRYYNGKAYNDGWTGEQVKCSNIIVQHVTYSWMYGDTSMPVVSLFGTGPCEYFIDGYHFTGTWERADVNSNTIYRDADGNEVIFKPGKTFIQVVKQGVAVNIDGTEAPGTLKNGSRGEDVKKLQQKLVDIGLLNDVVDGIYGGNTAAAVSAAEALLGMEQTGVANPDFLDALYAQ